MSRFVSIKKVGVGWDLISGTGPTGTTGPSGPASTGSGDITYIMTATSISGSYTGTDDYRLIFASGANVTVSLPYPEDEGRIYTIVNNSETLASVLGSDYGLWATGSTSYETWVDMTYGTGMFVAVYDSIGNSIHPYYSSTGRSWIYGGDTTIGSETRGVVYGDGRFIVLGRASSFAYSTNGTSWTKSTNFPTGPQYWRAIAFGSGTFVCIPEGSSSTGAYLQGTGSTFTAMYMGAARSWSDIEYGLGAFAALPSAGRTGAFSTDGVNWSDVVTPFTSYGRTLAFGNDRFVAFGGGVTSIYSTDGGYSWNIGNKVAINVSSVAFYDGEFVAIGGATSTSYHSTDGVYWRPKTMLTSNTHLVAGSGTGAPGVGVLSSGIVDTADFYYHAPWTLDKEENATYIYSALRWNRL